MNHLRKSLLPSGYRSLSEAPGCVPAIVRRSGEYHDLPEEEPPFTAGDLISLAVLYARALAAPYDYAEGFHGKAYHAVCAGLGIPSANDLTRMLGIGEPLEQPDFAGSEFFRRSGLSRFLWARSAMIGLQDPWGNVLEGDIWGRRSLTPGTPPYDALCRGIDAYTDAANALAGTVEALDNALCALLGWDAEKSVSYADLRTIHGMPEADYWP